jgi:hypothetical protein
MIKKLGFFDIFSVLKSDMPDFSVTRPDHIGKPLKFMDRLLIFLNLFRYNPRLITFISKNNNSINGFISLYRINNTKYWHINHLLLDKLDFNLLKQIFDSATLYIAQQRFYGILLKIPNNWQLINSAISAEFKIATQNIILTLGGQYSIYKPSSSYLLKVNNSKYKSDLFQLHENTFDFFVKKNLTYYDEELVQLCSMVDVLAKEWIYLEGDNLLGSLSKIDYRKTCSVSINILSKYINKLPEFIFHIYQIAKRKQLYWIVRTEDKDLLDNLQSIGLINQVSFYTLVYQSQTKIFSKKTSSISVAIEA